MFAINVKNLINLIAEHPAIKILPCQINDEDIIIADVLKFTVRNHSKKEKYPMINVQLINLTVETLVPDKNFIIDYEDDVDALLDYLDKFEELIKTRFVRRIKQAKGLAMLIDTATVTAIYAENENE